MLSQTTMTLAAPRRAPSAAKARRRRAVHPRAHAWFDLFHGQSLTWPDSETTVETIASAIRAA